jgi:SAM-dependent methyltransferase
MGMTTDSNSKNLSADSDSRSVSGYDYQAYDNFMNNPRSDYSLYLKPFLGDFLKKNKLLNILDWGCGSGILLDKLVESGFSGQYVGVDKNPAALKFCQAKIERNKLQKQSEARFSFFQPADLGLDTHTRRHFELVVASLSLSEMSTEEITEFLQNFQASQLLVINPSSLQFFYPTKISKTWWSRLISRMGATPRYMAFQRIPLSTGVDLSRQFYIHKINYQSNLQAKIFHRHPGELIAQIQNQAEPQRYRLKYFHLLPLNYPKHQPIIPKFEVYLFENS